MEESSSKSDDAGNEEKSPPKKARFDEQQPSSSSGSKRTNLTVQFTNEAASNSDTSANGKTEMVDEKETKGGTSYSVGDVPSASTSDDPVSAIEQPEATSSTTNEPGSNGGEENGRNGDTPSTSGNGDVADAENPSAASNNPRPRRNRQQEEFNRLRRNVHRLAYATFFSRNLVLNEYDDSSDDDYDFNDRDEYNGAPLADLLMPPEIFDDSDSSEGDPNAPAADGGAAQAEGVIRLPMMEFENESSSDSSYSELSSSSMPSSSEESIPSGSSESLPEFEDDQPEPEPVDINNLACLKMENLKDTWNIMLEMRQRQHGLSSGAKPAIAGRMRFNPCQFEKRAYGSVHMMQRMNLLHRLERHAGCVNSLSFNSSGKLLASGSDDLHVNLWNWESKKMLKSIISGHRSNVFQTKFMEYKGYEGELEIISTGRDGQVRHTRVDPSGRANTELLFRGRTPIHKIAIPARNEFSFLTADEDGKVRMYDLRQGKQEILKKLHRPLYTIATHPYDSEFCVAGTDSFVRVYDMRNTQKTLKLLASRCHAQKKPTGGVTCVVYNESGTEILASYSEDDIYLYDNIVNKSIVKPIRWFQGHCNSQTIKGVNFFGPRSEFVVSGSDCGNIFIWEKRTGIIANWLKGDRRGAVNCLEPHPEFPILATSGVDDDIKIWVPKGPTENQSVPVFAPQALEFNVRRNIRSKTISPRRLLQMSRPLSSYLNGRISPRIGIDPNSGQSDSEDLNDDDLMDGPPRMLGCNPS